MTRRSVAAVAIMALLFAGGYALYSVATQPNRYGTPNPSGLPAGGITEEMAIDIGSRLGTMAHEGGVRASAGYDDRLGRWIWHVSWSWYGGPTAAESCDVFLDFFTGEVVDRHCVVA